MKNQLSVRGKNDWWKGVVFYQIYPRSYFDSNNDGIGDLPGIIDKLDYLNNGTPDSLGIDAIWFSPFFCSPDYDYGYDVADYCAIDPRYGTMADFDRLLYEAHQRGIKVILDLVVNHTSHLHPWFIEACSSRKAAKRDWYIWHDGRQQGRKAPNNWRNNFFGSAWTWDEQTGQYYLHSFLKEQPDLNWANPAVREAIGDVIRFWLDRGADGFRLDVPHIYCKDKELRNNPSILRRPKVNNAIPLRDRTFSANLMRYLALPELQIRKYNQHQPETHAVLKEFRDIFNDYPGTTSVGEIVADYPEQIATYYGENDELHLNFYFELLHCRWNAGAFRRCIERWEKTLPSGAWPAYTFSNHDVARAISRYDQGQRGDCRARLLALMLLTLRGTPFIYYGEEIAMKEAQLPKAALRDPIGVKWYPLHRGRDGCRTPMQWSADSQAGFTAAEPWLPLGPDSEVRNVDDQAKDRTSMLNLYRKLIWQRKASPALSVGHFRIANCGEDLFCYLRESEKEKMFIALNLSGQKQEIDPIEAKATSRLLISTNALRVNGPVGFPLILEPDEGCLFDFS